MGGGGGWHERTGRIRAIATGDEAGTVPPTYFVYQNTHNTQNQYTFI